MAPLIVLVVVTAALWLADWLRNRSRVDAVRLPGALRGGLAAMFLVTGTAHFVGLREQMIAMVPPSLPNPGLIVTISGVLEILGAVGLVVRRTTRAAALCLGLMLVALFPANVYVATHGLQTEWLDNLIPRTVLQLIFLAAIVTVFRGSRSPAAGESRRSGGADAARAEMRTTA